MGHFHPFSIAFCMFTRSGNSWEDHGFPTWGFTQSSPNGDGFSTTSRCGSTGVVNKLVSYTQLYELWVHHTHIYNHIYIIIYIYIHTHQLFSTYSVRTWNLCTPTSQRVADATKIHGFSHLGMVFWGFPHGFPRSFSIGSAVWPGCGKPGGGPWRLSDSNRITWLHGLHFSDNGNIHGNI